MPVPGSKGGHDVAVSLDDDAAGVPLASAPDCDADGLGGAAVERALAKCTRRVVILFMLIAILNHLDRWGAGPAGQAPRPLGTRGCRAWVRSAAMPR